VEEKNIFGFHAVFYYYGIEHLLVNMYQYIKDGIDNNEYIYLCLEESTFNLLLNYFPKENKQHIGVISVSTLINLHKNGEEVTAKEAFIKYEKKVFVNGYIGARIICDSSHFLKESSKADFIKFQKFASEIINGLNISMMCLYDIYDYMNYKLIIDDELMAISQQVSDHRLYQMKLCENILRQ